MDMESKKKTKRLINSFKYAIQGINYTIKNEQNFLIHLMVSLLVIIFGFIFKINLFEWIICILLFGLVLGCELLNTSIEALTNLVSPKYDKFAKIAKDTSAAMVLVLAVTSALIGLIIFIPKII